MAKAILLDEPDRVGAREVDKLPFYGKEVMVSVLPKHVGEGIECHVPASVVALFWESMERLQHQFLWELVGHGARPLLRWEAGFPTFYRDFRMIPAVVDDVFHPLMTTKTNYLGREAVLEALEKEVRPLLVPFSYYSHRFLPRDLQVHVDGKPVGRITSSMLHPSRKSMVGWILLDGPMDIDETEASCHHDGQTINLVLHRRGERHR